MPATIIRIIHRLHANRSVLVSPDSSLPLTEVQQYLNNRIIVPDGRLFRVFADDAVSFNRHLAPLDAHAPRDSCCVFRATRYIDRNTSVHSSRLQQVTNHFISDHWQRGMRPTCDVLGQQYNTIRYGRCLMFFTRRYTTAWHRRLNVRG